MPGCAALQMGETVEGVLALCEPKSCTKERKMKVFIKRRLYFRVQTDVLLVKLGWK